MKRKGKIIAVFLSAVITASFGSMSAVAVDDDYYYYDVKKASDYALTFCDAGTGGEEEAYNNFFIRKKNTDYFADGANCTNYVSQILYYGGYKMRGTPDRKYNGVGTWYTNKWFYYRLEGQFGSVNDVWSLTWNTVDGYPILKNGFFQYFTRAWVYDGDSGTIPDLVKYTYADLMCSYVEDVKYCDDFAEKNNLKRGDIIQMDYQGDGILYDHTLYVWCTEPEIRVCSNSDDYFGKKLSDIAGKNKNAIYRIIRTTDHAIEKSAW